MVSRYRTVFKQWKKISPEFFWGDPMDFRFVIVEEISQLDSVNSLDVGCNVGIMLNQINSRLKVGIDINVESLKKGKRSFPDIEFIGASAECLPFTDSSFNLI